MGLSLVTRLGVCYDHGLTEPALNALGSTCYYSGNLFLGLPLPLPQQWSASVGFLISGSIVLYMILHDLHCACYCGSGDKHLLGLPLITAINAMFLPYIWF